MILTLDRRGIAFPMHGQKAILSLLQQMMETHIQYQFTVEQNPQPC